MRRLDTTSEQEGREGARDADFGLMKGQVLCCPVGKGPAASRFLLHHLLAHQPFTLLCGAVLPDYEGQQDREHICLGYQKGP